MTKYNFRIATPDDISGIFQVMENVGYTAAFYGGKSEKEVIPLLLDALFDKKKNITVVLCELGERIIGYSIFGPYAQYKKPIFPEEKENFAYSKGIGIHSDFQGKGLGMILKQASENIAKKQGYNGMYTDVATTNKVSLRLQEKAGFERIAELPDKSRPSGVNTVLFKKVF